MTSRPNIDPKRIPDDAWEFVGHSSDGLRRHWRAWINKEKGTYVLKTENLAEPEMLELNRQEFDDSHGKRFGDGRVVGRVPLNVFFRDFASRLKEGDRDFTKWWLNNPEHRPFRTFRGRI